MANANILMYVTKKNFDVQKAERFFKERGVKVQVVDMKKHPLGPREAEALVRGAGVENILDKDDKKVREHPVSYTSDVSRIIDYIVEEPKLMRAPVLRCGREVTVGNAPEVWTKWLEK